jgi:hypothetical protein
LVENPQRYPNIQERLLLGKIYGLMEG